MEARLILIFIFVDSYDCNAPPARFFSMISNALPQARSRSPFRGLQTDTSRASVPTGQARRVAQGRGGGLTRHQREHASHTSLIVDLVLPRPRRICPAAHNNIADNPRDDGLVRVELHVGLSAPPLVLVLARSLVS